VSCRTARACPRLASRSPTSAGKFSIRGWWRRSVAPPFGVGSAKTRFCPWRHRTWIFLRDPLFVEKAGPIVDLYQGLWQGHSLAPRILWNAGVLAKTKAGPPPNQDKWMWGTRVGALDPEAARCPECGCIVHQSYKRVNLVFTLIWCQVFALILAYGRGSKSPRSLTEPKGGRGCQSILVT